MARLFARKGERRDELLSAYMDGELSAEEQTRLEAQLQTDPALQAELDAMRHTVALVHDLPPVAIPRNFILSQAMLATARPQLTKSPRLCRVWNVPFLTTATAVVSLMFVVILAGDLLFAGRMGGDAALLGEQRMAIQAPAEAPAPVAVQDVAVEREVVVEAVVEESETQAMVEEVEAEVEAEATVGDDEQNAEQAPQDTSVAESALGGGGPTVEPAVATFIAAPSPSAELADVAPAPN